MDFDQSKFGVSDTCYSLQQLQVKFWQFCDLYDWPAVPLVLEMLHFVDCHIEIQSKTVRKAWREGGLGWGSGVEWGGGCERDALQGSTSWTPVQKSNGGIWLVRKIQISNLIAFVVCAACD